MCTHQDLASASGNVGTLMEVANCKRTEDGRMLLHVIGARRWNQQRCVYTWDLVAS
jgi:Lon protease-like protein